MSNRSGIGVRVVGIRILIRYSINDATGDGIRIGGIRINGRSTRGERSGGGGGRERIGDGGGHDELGAGKLGWRGRRESGTTGSEKWDGNERPRIEEGEISIEKRLREEGGSEKMEGLIWFLFFK